MPFAIEQRESMIVVTLSGVVGVEDLFALADALNEIDCASPGLNRVIDTSDATHAVLDFMAVARFADERSRSSPARNVRTAIVAVSGEAFGFARMFETLHRQPVAVRVFRRREEALAWLETTPGPSHGEGAPQNV